MIEASKNSLGDKVEIIDEFPDEALFKINERPWFADMTNFKAA